MIPQPEAHRLDLPGLALVCRRVVDRWSHEIHVESTPESRPVLISLEGEPNDPTPPSPAFQDLRIETGVDGGWEVQLFGQAGALTYSGAIRGDTHRATIEFDMCCRVRASVASPPFVGSVYRHIGRDRADTALRSNDWGAIEIVPSTKNETASQFRLALPNEPEGHRAQPLDSVEVNSRSDLRTVATSPTSSRIVRGNSPSELISIIPRPVAPRSSSRRNAVVLRWAYAIRRYGV